MTNLELFKARIETVFFKEKLEVKVQDDGNFFHKKSCKMTVTVPTNRIKTDGTYTSKETSISFSPFFYEEAGKEYQIGDHFDDTVTEIFLSFYKQGILLSPNYGR